MTYVGKKPADIIATAVDTTTGTFSGDLTVDTSTLYVDSANNNIGIGTTSVTAITNYTSVAIDGTTGSIIDLQHGGTINSRVVGESAGLLIDGVGSRFIKFHTNSTERMRIDSSGNLLVGKTSYGSVTGTGGQIGAGGVAIFTSSNDAPLYLNRTSTDGDIVDFYKDGSNVGSIGAEGGDLYIGTDDTGIEFVNGVNAIVPVNATSGADRDNAIDLGVGSIRFKDLYLSGEIDITGSSGAQITVTDNSPGTVSLYMGAGNSSVSIGSTTSDPLTFLTANSERMRIDSSGNLLVGTTDSNLTDNTTGSGVVAQANGALVVARQANTPFYVNRTGTSDGTLVDFRKDGGTVGSIGNNGTELFIGTPSGSGGYIRLQSAGIVPATSTGANSDGTMQLGTASGRFSDLYLSGGVYLGGTGSANKIDYYEEGTWTPSMGGTATYYYQTGEYTKIGDMVFLRGQVSINAIGTGSITTIQGLPFASKTTLNGNPAGSLTATYYSGLAISVNYIGGHVTSGSTNITIIANTGNYTTIQYNGGNFFGNGARLDFTMAYQTS